MNNHSGLILIVVIIVVLFIHMCMDGKKSTNDKNLAKNKKPCHENKEKFSGNTTESQSPRPKKKCQSGFHQVVPPTDMLIDSRRKRMDAIYDLKDKPFIGNVQDVDEMTSDILYNMPLPTELLSNFDFTTISTTSPEVSTVSGIMEGETEYTPVLDDYSDYYSDGVFVGFTNTQE